MTKEAIIKITPLCDRIVELKALKEKIEKEIKEAEADVKQTMRDEKIFSDTVGKYLVTLNKVAGGRVADTAKLKADGLYDQYSKPKADYEVLKIVDLEKAKESKEPEKVTKGK